MIRIIQWITLVTFAFLNSPLLLASAADTFTKEWQSWVEGRHQDLDCPWLISVEGKRICQWPGELRLDLHKGGLDFEYSIGVFAKEVFVPLPGDLKHWPSDIDVNMRPASVVERGQKPFIVLGAGKHQVRGKFQWRRQPSSIHIPENIAFVSLSKNASPLPVNRLRDKLIFSQKKAKAAAQRRDSITLEVYRLLQDDVPMMLETRLKLSVSGKSREINLGKLALPDTRTVHLQSKLPARIEDDGSIRVQVQAGEYRITVRSRFTNDVKEIRRAENSRSRSDSAAHYWPEYEYLSFQSNSDIRQAVLSGATSIDTTQVPIPNEWRNLPAYRLAGDSVLSISTEERGESSAASNQLDVSRELWLDFDGKAITSLDTIEGNMYQQWRLNSSDDTRVGRASVAGEAVLITEDEGRHGVEIRSPGVSLKAVSRIVDPGLFSAVGWDANAASYKARLHLPPGWRVLFVDGLDASRGSWLGQWDLWDIFLLLVLVAATHKLIGFKTAVFTGITLLATFHESGAPLLVWPVLLFIIAILPLLKSGRLKSLLSGAGLVASIMLVLIGIAFAVSSFRLAIYPSLERYSVSYFDQSQAGQYSAVSSQALEMVMSSEEPQLDSRNKLQVRKAASPKHSPNLYEVDENDRVQTGPGLPNWMWNSVSLSAAGPVSADEKIRVIYCPPLLSSLWRILNVFLIAGLSYILLRRLLALVSFSAINSGSAVTTASALAMLMVMGLSLSPDQSMADDYPAKYLLDELDSRITKPPACLPACVSINNGFLRADKDSIALGFEVYADTDLALPIPSGAGNWEPDAVLVDGMQKAVAARQDGTIVLLMERGHHRLILSGAVAADQITLTFPLAIHNFKASSDHWVIDGLVGGRVAGNTLSLRAKEKSTQQVDSLLPKPIAAFVIVEREFFLEKNWRVKTTVKRVAPLKGAVAVSIPLLAEEKILSDLKVKNGSVAIQLGHNQKFFSWESSMDPVEKISLLAGNGSEYFESWRIHPSSLWRISFTGIPPVKEQDSISSLQPHWKPWPGEKLDIAISRPEGVQGDVQTVERAALKYQPGYQLQKSTLSMDIRSSQGESYKLELPDGAEVTSLQLNGKHLNTPPGNHVSVQLQPGMQNLQLEFQESREPGWRSETPEIILPGNASNITLEYQLPGDRWPLYLSGPPIGPAMLIWGVLIVILLGAVLLPVFSKNLRLDMPVRLVDWLLLGVGLSTVNSYGVLMVALFFFVLAARKKTINPAAMTRFQFNFLQTGFLILTALTVLVLLTAIPAGLLSSPDMKVVGNNSYATFYNYYQDRASAGDFPTATVYSVSLMAYRLVMLAWSLWLATRLISWSVWWWAAFSAQSVWEPRLPATAEEEEEEDKEGRG